MIKFTELSFSFPEKELYKEVNFSIEHGQSCAFIGRSGSGKSTIAEIIMNPEGLVFYGKLEIEENLKIGYVSQFYDFDRTQKQTVFEYIASSFIEIQQRTEEICELMATADNIEELLELYQESLDRFEAVDGENYENSINKKLGLANLLEKRDLEVSKLSGGEFKIIQVIKQMLMKPDFLIMDEPDAFLDFENLKALKELINSYKGAMLTITHSRYLLNHCFNKIIHLENLQISEFDGNFISYGLDLLKTKSEVLEQSLEDRAEIARNEVLIDELRFIATNYDSVQNGNKLNARVKIQERLLARQVHNPFISTETADINFNYEMVDNGEVLVSVKDFSKAFEYPLLEDVSFDIKAGEKVAIIGVNGAGKTTLMNAIVENNDIAITLSDKVKIAYLTQDQNKLLGENNTIYDEFFESGFKSYGEIEEYLDTYHVQKEKLDKKMCDLSGGERNLLSIAKVSFMPSNLLILDEPTSHLDTYSQIELERAISAYEGAVLMISHDFYTIVNSADYVILIEDGTARKVAMRKFRKTIYANHFGVDYLNFEQEKKKLEGKIEEFLLKDDFESANANIEELEKLLKSQNLL